MLPGDIIDKQCTGSASIVRPGNRSKGFLTGLPKLRNLLNLLINCNLKKIKRNEIWQIERNRVPYLEFDRFVVDCDHPSPKFNADSQIVNRLEPLVREL